jgi:hypothetical protein
VLLGLTRPPSSNGFPPATFPPKDSSETVTVGLAAATVDVPRAADTILGLLALFAATIDVAEDPSTLVAVIADRMAVAADWLVGMAG